MAAIVAAGVAAGGLAIGDAVGTCANKLAASAVEQMQQQIVDAIRRLEDGGEITRSAGEEEEQFVS